MLPCYIYWYTQMRTLVSKFRHFVQLATAQQNCQSTLLIRKIPGYVTDIDLSISINLY